MVIIVFKRKIVKNGKTYYYFYKSKRVGSKVKSIYVGRELANKTTKSKKKKISKIHKKKTKGSVKKVKKHNVKKPKYLDQLQRFDVLIDKIKEDIELDNKKMIIKEYNELYKVYAEIIDKVSDQKKIELFNKIKEVYNQIQSI
ncbi:hypothetical protein K8R47_03005 [archaeon]|nr:hypothetical protein [archaeon]